MLLQHDTDTIQPHWFSPAAWYAICTVILGGQVNAHRGVLLFASLLVNLAKPEIIK